MKTMKTQEVAKVLCVSDRTVRRHASVLFPEIVKNGKVTQLNEFQVTRIKQEIERSGRNDLDNVVQVQNATTDHEMLERTLSVMEWLSGKVQVLQSENSQLRPIAAAHLTLTDAEGSSTIAEVAKVLGFGEISFFRKLREHRILQSGGVHHNIPYQKYIDKGWFRLRAYTLPVRTAESDKNEIRHQTMVTALGESELAKIFPRTAQLELLR